MSGVRPEAARMPSVVADSARYEAVRNFSVREAHQLVKDLFKPRVGIYWVDFLVSLAVGGAAFWAVGPLGYWQPSAVVMMMVSVLAFFRCFAFIHEIAHFRGKDAFRRFRIGWNVLFGIPAMAPVFMYDGHSEHHNKRLYGTIRDAEYLPLARLSPWASINVLLASFLLPLFGPVRFGVLTPISWCVPKLRGFLYRNMATLKIDLEYEGRPPATRRERLMWTSQEVGCLAVVISVVVLLLTGIVPVERVLQFYVLYSGIALVNAVRLLAAHRYLGDEEEMSLVEQMMDTVNHPRHRWFTELWAPVGLRLHALHHLFPGLPYHAYATAHRRLIEGLPADSAYRMTESSGLSVTLRELWRTVRAHQKAGMLLRSGNPAADS